MSVFSRTIGRIMEAREQEARRHLQAYMNSADRDLASFNGFTVDGSKDLPF